MSPLLYNLLFKGISEKRRENCFEEVRRVIHVHDELGIERDIYRERAHRLGDLTEARLGPYLSLSGTFVIPWK